MAVHLKVGLVRKGAQVLDLLDPHPQAGEQHRRLRLRLASDASAAPRQPLTGAADRVVDDVQLRDARGEKDGSAPTEHAAADYPSRR